MSTVTNIIPMNDRIRREYMTATDKTRKEETEDLRPKHWTDYVIDLLTIAVLVMLLVFALRLVAGLKQDRKEVATYESHRAAFVGDSMETYGELHTDGTSVASMVYSDGYRAFYDAQESEGSESLPVEVAHQ